LFGEARLEESEMGWIEGGEMDVVVGREGRSHRANEGKHEPPNGMRQSPSNVHLELISVEYSNTERCRRYWSGAADPVEQG